MHNSNTIDFIFKNKQKILKGYSDKFKNSQIAEDCLQHLLLKLIQKEYNIESPGGFISSSMMSIYFNYKRTNKKYSLSDQSESENFNELFLDGEGYYSMETSEDLDNLKIMMRVYREVEKLPKTQRGAIIRRINEQNEATNTEKANYRHGILKLQERLSPLKEIARDLLQD